MPTIAPRLRSVVDHDGAVILDLPRDAMLTLNPTGGYIWQRLCNGKSIDEIIHELAADTGSNIETVDRDVRSFMDQLKARHLFAEPMDSLL
jgi:hypothetical protein